MWGVAKYFMHSRYIFITGGVVSSLGKGITAASIGLLLKSRGYSVVNQKFDPYLNVDPGTMDPYQHGEVFVTQDGAETDLDLGHYERFTDVALKKFNSTSAGKVYLSIFEKERRGAYNGGTVQVVPHVTDEIQLHIMKAEREEAPDFIISEIGGTVGDIEALPFIEAIRQMRYKVGKENCMFIHLGLLPFLKASGEVKTKPMQHSVKELLSFGIQPDSLICRSEKKITPSVKSKLSLFSNVPEEAIIENITTSSIYDVPLKLEEAGLGSVICKAFNMEEKKPKLEEWKKMAELYSNPLKRVSIAVVGKYVELADAYLSVTEALTSAGIYHKTGINIVWVDSKKLKNIEDVKKSLLNVDGILVPGGFGKSGIEGIFLTCQYARENNIPFLGICLGMQIAIIEYARNVLGIKEATSTEFDVSAKDPLITLIEGKNNEIIGGTLRLGLYSCTLKEGSLAESIYNRKEIKERHRHRYEVNNAYKNRFKDSSMLFSGINEEKDLVEMIELKDHKWFVASQFHPEFASRPNRCHPLFKSFVEATLKK